MIRVDFTEKVTSEQKSEKKMEIKPSRYLGKEYFRQKEETRTVQNITSFHQERKTKAYYYYIKVISTFVPIYIYLATLCLYF